MKIVIGVLLLCVLVYIGYEFIRIRGLVHKSSILVENTKPFERTAGAFSILVIGDSTAIGVGSDTPENSVAGRLSQYLDARVENHAVSGAVTADMHEQFSQARESHYDLIVIHTGANDVVRFHSLSGTTALLDILLRDARTRSDRVVLITAGKVGRAPLFPKLFGWMWTLRAHALRDCFIATAQADGAVYINLYSAPDLFSTDPEKYYAADSFHPSQYGYAFWFDQMKDSIAKSWPDIVPHGN
jgi:lysophospholipase L1-like esterase